MEKLTKKYGLLTAICMVVGIVIGSGVFFKAGKVLSFTNGNIGKTLAVVAIVGGIMIICSLVFATLAQKHEKVNGIVDYAEATLGKRYAYYVGWFMSTIYYPTLTSVLGWISASYTCSLFNIPSSTGAQLALAGVYLVAGFAVNSLSPRLAGRFQVSATFIKLIPLVLMGVVGLIVGLVNGKTIDAFKANIVTEGLVNDGGFFAGVAAFAFAYEGWIVATSINGELKNAKRNLPIALIVGAIIIIAVYLLYFLGLTGALSTEDMLKVNAGQVSGSLPQNAFTALFKSPAFGTIIMVFVIISCLGTMNGLMLGCCRGFYSISARNVGPKPGMFGELSKETNMPQSSSILGLLLCFVWLVQWEFFFMNPTGKIPAFWCWESDEVSIITLYAFYIPIFIAMMVKGKDLNVVKRFILPILGVACCCFMCFCAYDGYKANGQIWSYLIVFAIIMFVGFLFSEDFKKIVGKIKKKCVKVEVVGDAVAAEIAEGSVDNFVSESDETENAKSPAVDENQAENDTETTAE